ncbi:MAG: DUF1684 domain-containing protein [Pseudoclavibacter sp.]
MSSDTAPETSAPQPQQLPAPSQPHEPGFATAWKLWHDEVERRRADPYGFLSITGLYWLTAEPQSIPGVPGQWSLPDDGRARVRLAEGEILQTPDEITVDGLYVFPRLSGEESVSMTFDDIDIEVAARGGQVIVRPRDPENPLLKRYEGTPAFEPDPAWRIPGRFLPFEQPRQIEHGTVAGYSQFDAAPGEVEFEVAGQTQRVVVYGDSQQGLMLVFRDGLAGVETAPANRRLDLEAPAADGSVLLDFNRTVNFPCAYTDAATCPLPPSQNVLAIGIRAGEKLPRRG